MLGADANGLSAAVGYPGLSVGYQRGVSDSMDAGARFSFNYGGQGVPSLPGMGLKLAGDIKLKLDAPFGALVLRVLPGVDLSFPPGFTVFNVSLPLELAYGFLVGPNLLVHASVQAPLGVGFWSGFGVSITSVDLPALFGGGLEYKIDHALSVHGTLHLGPYQRILLGGSATQYFALGTQLGITYRL